MAVFEIADKLTRKNEGGYSNNSADAGGETYKGIARKFHSYLSLWGIIDKVKAENPLASTKELNAKLEIIPDLQTQIDSFYRQEFWDTQRLSLVTSQLVANWIYDHHVNAGARGIQWAQEVAGVPADGEIGPVSIYAINKMNPDKFLQRAEDIAAFYRLERAEKIPSQIQFLPSWLRRDGVSQGEIAQVMAMAKNGLTHDEVLTLKGIIETTV